MYYNIGTAPICWVALKLRPRLCTHKHTQLDKNTNVRVAKISYHTQSLATILYVEGKLHVGDGADRLSTEHKQHDSHSKYMCDLRLPNVWKIEIVAWHRPRKVSRLVRLLTLHKLTTVGVVIEKKSNTFS